MSSIPSFSFHFYCWCLSIGLDDSGACLQFSCGLNWSLVGRSVCESVRECVWVGIPSAGSASLPCRAAAIETSTGLEAKLVRTSSSSLRSKTENQPTLSAASHKKYHSKDQTEYYSQVWPALILKAYKERETNPQAKNLRWTEAVCCWKQLDATWA